MRELIKAKSDFVCQEISAEDAKKLFKDQVYKIELIEGLGAARMMTVINRRKVPLPPIHPQAVDLAVDRMLRTPSDQPTRHKTAQRRRCLLAGTSTAGCCSELRAAWETKDEQDYLWKLKKPKRDHRKLEKAGSIRTNDEAGQGDFVAPNGGMIRRKLALLG